MEAADYLYGTNYGTPFLDGKKSSGKFTELKNGVQLQDFFHIDDLLDFSNEEIAGPIGDDDNNWPSCTTTTAAAAVAADSSTITLTETVSSNSSLDGKSFRAYNVLETDANNNGHLCVPCDDLAELEWLSNFVEDSFSTEQAAKPIFSPNFGDVRTDKEEEKPHIVNPIRSTSPLSGLDTSCSSWKAPSFSPDTPVPGRARSKRSRAPACNWSSRIVSPASSVSALENGPTSSVLSSDSEFFAESYFPAKKPAKMSHGNKKREQEQQTQIRKCMHCDTTKTPQWRTGPMGPKTLCNACGVRYKSGRLVPEYRPAASPTFVLSKHSNSHRKVIEMRRQKELHEALQHASKLYPNDNGGNEDGDEYEEDEDGSDGQYPHFGSDDDNYLVHTNQDYRHFI